MKGEVMKKETSVSAKSEYDEQRELFRRFGLPVDGRVMSTMEIVKREGGKYALVKRTRPVDVVLDTDGTSPQLVARLQKTASERVLGGLDVKLDGLSRETQRAVMDNVLCSSVEPGETEAWA